MITFERGNSSRPRGHALLYFQDAADPERLLATYIVVLPIAMDVTKYIPPMMASQMAGMSFKEFSAFAVPPVPEPVEGLDSLWRLADLRDEDVVHGGSLSSQDVARAMEAVNEAVQSYASLWSDYTERASTTTSTPAEALSGEGVNEVLYSLMGERDRLGELSKLLGTLRYAAERNDQALIQETGASVRALGRYLSEQHKVDRIVEAAKDPSERGARLAKLYLDRAYRLCEQDFRALEELDKAIQEVESSNT